MNIDALVKEYTERDFSWQVELLFAQIEEISNHVAPGREEEAIIRAKEIADKLTGDIGFEMRQHKIMTVEQINLMMKDIQESNEMMGSTIAKIEYTLDHRIAYAALEARLKLTSTESWFHDMNKVILHIVEFGSSKRIQEMHRMVSSHHLFGDKPTEIKDPIGAIWDWECAAVTKPDKPLNALDTCKQYYSQVSGTIFPILEYLDLSVKRMNLF